MDDLAETACQGPRGKFLVNRCFCDVPSLAIPITVLMLAFSYKNIQEFLQIFSLKFDVQAFLCAVNLSIMLTCS